MLQHDGYSHQKVLMLYTLHVHSIICEFYFKLEKYFIYFNCYLVFHCMIYQFLRATVINCHKLDGIKQKFSQSSGAQKSEVKVLAKFLPSGGSWEDQFHAFLLVFGSCQQPLEFLGLWMHHSKFCLHLLMTLSSDMSVSPLLSQGQLSLHLKPTLIQHELILRQLT